MAAIHDRYTVLPPQGLRRPGALLRAVLRHRDSAQKNNNNNNNNNNHNNNSIDGIIAAAVGGKITASPMLGPAITQAPAEQHHYQQQHYYRYVGGPARNQAQTQAQGPPTGVAATAPPAPPGALSASAVPSNPAGLVPPNPNVRSPLSIRHARSTSSPLPVSPFPPTTTPLDKRRASRLSSPIATMPEYRHMRSGSLSIPSAAHGAGHHHSMPRSPPSTFRLFACENLRLALLLLLLPPHPDTRPRDEGKNEAKLATDALTVCCCLQTHRTSRASFSARAPARPAMPVPLATIWALPRRTFASILPR